MRAPILSLLVVFAAALAAGACGGAMAPAAMAPAAAPVAAIAARGDGELTLDVLELI